MRKKKKEGFKSLGVLRKKKVTAKQKEKLQSKRVQMAVRSELIHKLETHLASNDSVQFEVSENVLPLFLDLLSDPIIESVYEFIQEDACLFTFTQKSLL